MPQVKKVSRTKIIVYVVVIVTMLLGNVFIYFRNSKVPQVDPNNVELYVAADPAYETPSSVAGQPLSLRQKVLEHNLFMALQKTGDWPLKPTNVGKADPFAPFFSP